MMMPGYKNIFNRSTNRRGAALLIVLIVVMAVTIVSLGFLSRSSVQLECGENMLLHTQMDYLAESALEYAREQIIFPQNTDGEYWTGVQGIQFNDSPNHFSDVNVLRTANCNYAITADSYRLVNGQKTANSRLTANLRLNPAIAYWQVKSTPISLETTINGDIYCVDNLKNYGQINGDAYSTSTITNFVPGVITGQKYQNIPAGSFVPPSFDINNFKTQYYIGDNLYSTGQLSNTIYNNLVLGPTETNPAGIYYCDSDIELNGGSITGMLVVKNDIRISGPNVVTITAVKNFPAILTGHNILFENIQTTLNVTGLVCVAGMIDFKSNGSCSLNINGCLSIDAESIQNTAGSRIEITALPDVAAIQIWLTSGTKHRWSPATGAVFQQIMRNQNSTDVSNGGDSVNETVFDIFSMDKGDLSNQQGDSPGNLLIEGKTLFEKIQN